MNVEAFYKKGWAKFGYDEATATWAKCALNAALPRVQDPSQQDAYLRHGKTWFVGVNSLLNDVAGHVEGQNFPPKIRRELTQLGWGELSMDRAQVSVIYPGYPKQDRGESDANHRFRRLRDAAHVDGLLPIGADRKRMLREPHAYVLGIPLTRCSPDSSPMVVWEGSHHIMQRAFKAAFAPYDPEHWDNVDVTQIYHKARRDCFETCKRIEVSAVPGEFYLVHRLSLHGVAPWGQGAKAPVEGRMIAYFRPELRQVEDWLTAR